MTMSMSTHLGQASSTEYMCCDQGLPFSVPENLTSPVVVFQEMILSTTQEPIVRNMGWAKVVLLMMDVRKSENKLLLFKASILAMCL